VTTSSDPVHDDSKNTDISEDDINKAQQEWCDRLVAISRAYRNRQDYRKLANDMIDDLYDFTTGQTFFRPTLASSPYNFRTTREGALSYFINENPKYDDEGFALKTWESAWYDNDVDDIRAIQRHGPIGLAMGHVHLSDREVGGNVTTVDKTFVYLKRTDGSVRMIVHMSALTNPE
jgi:hypothetical protein